MAETTNYTLTQAEIEYNSTANEIKALTAEIQKKRDNVKLLQIVSAILLLAVIVLLFLYFKK